MTFAYRKIYKLDKRFTIELSKSAERLECNWRPHLPTGKKLRSLTPAYHKALASFMSEISTRPVAIVSI